MSVKCKTTIDTNKPFKKILILVIISTLPLFKIHRKVVFGNTSVIVQNMLGKTPKSLNAVYMMSFCLPVFGRCNLCVRHLSIRILVLHCKSMARIPRSAVGDMIYHVINRANDREQIFQSQISVHKSVVINYFS